MMNFPIAIERILSHEGGYVNDPLDPGGETQWGISKRSYPHLDIKALTRDEAKLLYERDFWRAVAAASTLDDAMRYQLLDAAVNHGMGNAVRLYQGAVGAAKDGHWGPQSQAALDAMDVRDVHLLFIAERLEFWAALKSFDRFGRGWTRRGAQNLRYLAGDN